MHQNQAICCTKCLLITQLQKGALKPNKPAYIRMCILEFIEVVMNEIHHIALMDTTSLMHEILNTKNVYEDFSTDKEMFNFSNYWDKSK